MAVKNPEELSKYLVSWIERLAKGLGKKSIAVIRNGTTASNLVAELATRTSYEVSSYSDEADVPDNVLLLGTNTRDNYEVARGLNRRGGVAADVLPLAALHESEVESLARYLEVDVEDKYAAVSIDADPLDIERSIRLTQDFFGKAGSNEMNHLSQLLKKHGLGTEKLYSLLHSMAENEVLTRRMYNPNIPIPNVRMEGLGYVE